MHPAFQNLSIAMRLLHGLGRPLMRMIVLQHAENVEDEEKGLLGNTILLANPTPQQLLAVLPPSEEDMVTYFSVVFDVSSKRNGRCMTREDIKKKEALKLNREEYFQGVRIRKAVCPVFLPRIWTGLSESKLKI